MGRAGQHIETAEPLGPLAIDAILAPRRALRAAVRRRRALDLFAALAVFFSSTAMIATSVAASAMRAILDCGAAPKVHDGAEAAFRRQRVRSAVGEPLLLAVRAGSSTIALLLGGAAFGRAPPWAAAWRVALVAEIPEGVGRIVDLEALLRFGPEMTLEMAPVFRPAISLAELAGIEHVSPVRNACAERISPFLLWSVVLAAIGARECGGSRRSALAAAAAAVLFALGIAASGAALREGKTPGELEPREGAPLTTRE